MISAKEYQSSNSDRYPSTVWVPTTGRPFVGQMGVVTGTSGGGRGKIDEDCKNSTCRGLVREVYELS